MATLYQGVIDAMINDSEDPDPPPSEVRSFSTATFMHSSESRATVARAVIKVGETLAAS